MGLPLVYVVLQFLCLIFMYFLCIQHSKDLTFITKNKVINVPLFLLIDQIQNKQCHQGSWRTKESEAVVLPWNTSSMP